jgi:hypothetical protein
MPPKHGHPSARAGQCRRDGATNAAPAASYRRMLSVETRHKDKFRQNLSLNSSAGPTAFLGNRQPTDILSFKFLRSSVFRVAEEIF